MPPRKKPTTTRKPDSDSFEGGYPIVGIGASAGGLEAFTQLFQSLPASSGMAFVLIQHLDPTHPSFLATAVRNATPMAVHEAEDGMQVEADHVYVIPPNADIALLKGRLSLLPRHDEAGKPHLPIDFFFRSLAADGGGRAIGVVLSGTASDGTEGLRAIKAEDGITFVQSPKTAKFSGMPQSALNARVVDYALAIPELAEELMRLSHHPYLAARQVQPNAIDEHTLMRLFVVVRDAVGVDFSEYKLPTFARRLARRMAVCQIDDPEHYLMRLRSHPEEIAMLFDDALINVTSFFRDAPVFESLKTEAFPEILKNKPEGAPIRAWVAGCATGEEVYSLAIALLEFLGDRDYSYPIQIFGSDVSEKAIERARLGVYSDSALAEVSDERRRRYFSRADAGYRIAKSVRDLCVFVRHDLARDPPFAKLDLVSCRNVLIYFDQPLQKRVLSTFHYALSQPGFLVLGRTEGISGFGQLFSTVDKENKVFRRTTLASTLRFAVRPEVHPSVREKRGRGPRDAAAEVDLGKLLDRTLVSRYAPPGLLIDDKAEILQFRGDTSRFLQFPSGEPQNNVFKLARAPLLAVLRATLDRAKQEAGPARASGVEIEHDGVVRTCDIEIVPFASAPDGGRQLFVVTFDDHAAVPGVVAAPVAPTPDEGRRLARVERDLAAATEYARSLMEDHDATVDELNSVNEELLSGNEELQSLNEELETAKEELQSTNEELTTVNEELHARNEEVNLANGDLINLLGTVDMPVVILDREKRIRRLTPKARSILNVVPADVGRPLEDLRMNVEVTNLDARISEVIENNTVHEAEVRDRGGRWYRMQIRPYRTTDDRIDGATLSLVDIDALKHHIKEAQQARAEAEQAGAAKDQFLATLSHELRTPLSTMLMHAQMLRIKGTDARTVKRVADAVERGTRLQVQLIEDLLDVTRIATGKLKMAFEPVDLAAVVRAVLEGADEAARKGSIRLGTVIEPAIGRVAADPARLQQVVSNLVTNAIKFTPPNGQVTVLLRSENGRAILTVSDTGMGIDPGFLPHIFDRFSQKDGSTTRGQGGLGLGLAIVRHIVELHGGSVHAESAGPGKGASFVVTLGLIAGSAELLDENGHVDEPQGASPNGGGTPDPRLRDLRVLVVDDDEAARDAVAEMLGQTGARVRMASSAADALAAVQEFAPEVLLCDIAMPGEDGYALIRKIRALDPAHGGDVPAVALTALASDADRQHALEAGFQVHVSKPVDLARLTSAIFAIATPVARASAP